MRECATTKGSELRNEELAVLLKILAKEGFYGKHLEVGTAAGGTLWQMMKSSRANKDQAPFVVVDPMTYFPNQMETVKRNLQDNGEDPYDVDFRVCTSQEAVTQAIANKEIFDFILIDGAHKIHRVTEDLQWAKCLRVGGIIAFHDYCPDHRGVFWAVNRFMRRHDNFRQVAHVGSLLMLRKRSPSKGPEVTAFDRIFARFWAPILNLEISLKKRLK